MRLLAGYWLVMALVLISTNIILWNYLGTPSRNLEVKVSPPLVTLSLLQTQQFTATIPGATNEMMRAVKWQPLPPGRGYFPTGTHPRHGRSEKRQAG